jgi:hypothetical protein
MRFQDLTRLYRLPSARFLSLAWSAMLASCVVAAEQPTVEPSPPVNESLSSLAQRIVLENLPKQFVDQRNWGHTTRVINGLHFDKDGDGLRIEKHTKEVKDGIWKQYRIDLVDPEHQLHVQIANLRQLDSSHSAFTVLLSAKLHADGRWEQWKDGVKLLNVNAAADSRIEARIDCEMTVDWKPVGLLGQITVEPKVTGARLDLVDFDLKKVSKIEGRLAHELGERLKETLAKRLHDEEPKVVEKLNRAIQQRQDRLRFSPGDVVANGFSSLESLFDAGKQSK